MRVLFDAAEAGVLAALDDLLLDFDTRERSDSDVFCEPTPLAEDGLEGISCSGFYKVKECNVCFRPLGLCANLVCTRSEYDIFFKQNRWHDEQHVVDLRDR